MTEEIGNMIKKKKMIRNSQKYCKMTDILTDKMTDKELQRLKILRRIF